MKVILMNQNKKVLLAEMDESNTFQEIYEYYNINYAPLSLYNAYNHNEDVLVALNSWFKGRGIPAWRQNIEKLLEKLNVVSPTELLNKAYGLSLSDQYWIKGERQNLKWKDINFFTNDFEYKDYLDVSLNSNSRESSTRISLHSPNNTTDGMVKKGWIIDKDNNNISNLVSVESSLNTNVLGVYTITYSILLDNQLKTLTREVEVKEKLGLQLNYIDKNTNQDVLVSINALGSDFLYLKLPDGRVVNSRSTTFTISNNGTYVFYVYDSNNNYGSNAQFHKVIIK